MLVQRPRNSNILWTSESAFLENTLETCPREFWACWLEQNMLSGKRTHTHTHTHTHTYGLLFRRKPIVQRGDRWRGQAMSEEVTQKQAEDCFLRLPLLRCLQTLLVRALRQGTTFQLREKALFTCNNKSLLCKCKKKKYATADYFNMMHLKPNRCLIVQNVLSTLWFIYHHQLLYRIISCFVSLHCYFSGFRLNRCGK